jgi:hypothetical protein
VGTVADVVVIWKWRCSSGGKLENRKRSRKPTAKCIYEVMETKKAEEGGGGGARPLLGF